MKRSPSGYYVIATEDAITIDCHIDAITIAPRKSIVKWRTMEDEILPLGKFCASFPRSYVQASSSRLYAREISVSLCRGDGR